MNARGQAARMASLRATCTQCGGRGSEVPAGILLGGEDLWALQWNRLYDQRSMYAVPWRGLAGQVARVLVKVPAGVDRTRESLPGRRRGGRFGGPSGDLYVVLSVKAHKFFEREGDDLHCVLPSRFRRRRLVRSCRSKRWKGRRRSRYPKEHRAGARLNCEAKVCRT